MDMREMLVIIGVVLITVILWDGLRRMRNKKANRYRGAYTQDAEELKKKEELSRELPNGGARVRTMTEEEKEDLSTRLNLRERVPMLMDSVEEVPGDPSAEPDDDEAANVEQHSLDFDAPPAPEPGSRSESVAEEAVSSDWDPAPQEQEDAILHFSARDDDDTPPDPTFEPATRSRRDVDLKPDATEEPSELEPRSVPGRAEHTANRGADEDYQDDPSPVEELVIMHVMAPEGEAISGSDLLETLLRAGLRFGPLDIFHYRNPKGQLEFSLANCVQPGTLDPDTMEQMTTPGITLFMQLPLRADMMEAFDHMYEMAVFLSRHLGAELLDDEHSTITPQRVEHYRERLRNFARSQLIQAH